MADYVSFDGDIHASLGRIVPAVTELHERADRYRTERDEWHAVARERAERIVKLCEARDSARNLRDEYREAYHQAEAERNTLARENAQLRSELAAAKETAATRSDALLLRLAVPGGVATSDIDV